jgi:hypothetical protein
MTPTWAGRLLQNRAATGSARIKQDAKGWQCDQHRAKLKQNRHARTPRHALALRQLNANAALHLAHDGATGTCPFG